jgi:hypothetical protein
MGIFINGRRIGGRNARDLTITNGVVYIDGKRVDDDEMGPEKTFNITIEGDLGSLSVDSGTVSVAGSATTIKTLSGDVTVDGDVGGGVSTMSGDVTTRGSINGPVSTMSGDVIQRG